MQTVVNNLFWKRLNKSENMTIKRKRGQMKIQQMAFMLMAVTLFFVLVGLFVLVWSFAGIKEGAVALEEKNTMLLATKLANSPEFSCGNSFGGTKINCIDADKVINLKGDISKYIDFWGKGVNNIKIETIYPVTERKDCTLGNYPNCNVIDLFSKGTQGIAYWNFVTICKKAVDEGRVYDKCEIGKVFVYSNGV